MKSHFGYLSFSDLSFPGFSPIFYIDFVAKETNSQVFTRWLYCLMVTVLIFCPLMKQYYLLISLLMLSPWLCSSNSYGQLSPSAAISMRLICSFSLLPPNTLWFLISFLLSFSSPSLLDSLSAFPVMLSSPPHFICWITTSLFCKALIQVFNAVLHQWQEGMLLFPMAGLRLVESTLLLDLHIFTHILALPKQQDLIV